LDVLALRLYSRAVPEPNGEVPEPNGNVPEPNGKFGEPEEGEFADGSEVDVELDCQAT
jgi:hypothetical protein